MKPNNRNRDPDTGRIIKEGGWGYEIKYDNKKRLYKLNNDWVIKSQIPEYKKWASKENIFFHSMYEKIKERSKKHKKWVGEIEFKSKEDLLYHWHKQKEKYGNKCPITKQILTTKRGTGITTMTNISPDRLFSPIHYTKQNVLFTTTGWNLCKNALKYYQMPVYLKHENCQRYFKILHERFPEYEDIGWEVIDGHDWNNEGEIKN